MARSSRPKTPPQRYPISTSDGKHHGEYRESGDMVTVYYNGDRKTAHVGGLPVETLARMVLSEMSAGRAQDRHTKRERRTPAYTARQDEPPRVGG